MGDVKCIDTALDMAYLLLKREKQEHHYRYLLQSVLITLGTPSPLISRAMAELLTQINMDSRFASRGQGKWGLTEWMPPQRPIRLQEEKVAALPDKQVQRYRIILEEVQLPDSIDASFASEDEDAPIAQEDQDDFEECQTY